MFTVGELRATGKCSPDGELRELPTEAALIVEPAKGLQDFAHAVDVFLSQRAKLSRLYLFSIALKFPQFLFGVSQRAHQSHLSLEKGPRRA